MSAHVGRFIRDLKMNVYPRGASQFFHLPVTLHFLTHQIMVAFPSLLICTFVSLVTQDGTICSKRHRTA